MSGRTCCRPQATESNKGVKRNNYDQKPLHCLAASQRSGAFAEGQAFKVGDYVDADRLLLGKWEPCKVSKPLDRNQYGVDCGPNLADLQPGRLRARAATGEDKRVDAETAAALARQPHSGNSLGTLYGSREPVTCASRAEPARGAPSATQARQYFICDQEREPYRNDHSLVTNVTLQIASVSHPVNIRGSFTQYGCAKLTSIQGCPNGNDFARTHNCIATAQPSATGYCYKNTFGDWHCGMADAAHVNTNPLPFQLPPGRKLTH
jgi:hypothetical protein